MPRRVPLCLVAEFAIFPLVSHAGSMLFIEKLLTDGLHARNGPATLLPRLEDCKMIGMIDENAPEKAKGQQSVEVRGAGVLAGADEGDERDLG